MMSSHISREGSPSSWQKDGERCGSSFKRRHIGSMESTRRVLGYLLICLFIHLSEQYKRICTCSRAHGKDFFTYDMNESISYSFYPLCFQTTSQICRHQITISPPQQVFKGGIKASSLLSFESLTTYQNVSVGKEDVSKDKFKNIILKF